MAVHCRYLQVPTASANYEYRDLPSRGTVFDGVRRPVYGARGRWARLDSSTAQTSGALGVLLAKQLRVKMHVPVGIIQVPTLLPIPFCQVAACISRRQKYCEASQTKKPSGVMQAGSTCLLAAAEAPLQG